MDILQLVLPSAEYAAEIAAYRREFLDAGDSMDGTGSLRAAEDPMEWLARTKELSDPAALPRGMVQTTQFLTLREGDGRLVGMFQVRHTLNEYLTKFGGHIGYSVRPSERRRGYASEQLRLALPRCKAIGLNRLLVTCLRGNRGSRKVILKNGGVFERTVYEPNAKKYIERYWIALP